MSPAQMFCWLVAAGALVTGAIMVIFSAEVAASADHPLVDSVVHLSNVKFMAAMWCVVGVVFAVGASHLHDPGAWRLLRIACIGISVAAAVRLVEMVRLDSYSTFGLIAAAIELVVPPGLIYLRNREYRGVGT